MNNSDRLRRNLRYRRRKVLGILLDRQGIICHWCGGEFGLWVDKFGGKHWTELTIDHLLPLAEGGNNDIDNLVLSCDKCNRDRGGQVELPKNFKAIMLVNPDRPPHLPVLVESSRETGEGKNESN